MQPGANDLGDLILAEVPFLAGGRIEWTGGAPVDLARLLPWGIGVEHLAPGLGQAWLRDPEARWRDDGEGRFSVWALAEEDRYRIRLQPMLGSALSHPAMSDPVEFEPGERDVLRAHVRAWDLVAAAIYPPSNSLPKEGGSVN